MKKLTATLELTNVVKVNEVIHAVNHLLEDLPVGSHIVTIVLHGNWKDYETEDTIFCDGGGSYGVLVNLPKHGRSYLVGEVDGSTTRITTSLRPGLFSNSSESDATITIHQREF